jgi:hypothetical protein
LEFKPTSPTTNKFEDNEPKHILVEQVKIMVEMHRFAHDCVKAAQAHMQEYANRHRLPVPFVVGDKVKLKAASLQFIQACFKQRDRYVGPFFITENLNLKLFTTCTVCTGLQHVPYAPVAISAPSQQCHS